MAGNDDGSDIDIDEVAPLNPPVITARVPSAANMHATAAATDARGTSAVAAGLSLTQMHLNGFAIHLDFSSTNGILEVGIAAGVDPSIADEFKVPVVSHYADVAATHAAIWALKQFSSVRAISPYYVAAAYMVIRAGLVARNDGDSRFTYALPNEEPSAEVKNAVTAACSVQNCKAVVGAIIATKVNWWLQNHHTGQGKMVGYAAKYASNSFNEYESYQDDFKDFMHTIGHWASTKRVLSILDIPGIQQVEHIAGDITIKVSDDVKIRIGTSPAGTHKHAVAMAGIRRLLNHPVGQFVNIGTDAIIIARACSKIKDNPAAYHIGAKYLTGRERANFNDADAGIVLGRVGTFLTTFFNKTSLAKSPHIKKQDVAVYQEYDDFSGDFERICSAYKDMMIKADAAMFKKLEEVSNSAGIARFAPLDTLKIIDAISRGENPVIANVAAARTPATGGSAALARFAATHGTTSSVSPNKKQKMGATTAADLTSILITTPAVDLNDDEFDIALSDEMDAQELNKGGVLNDQERERITAAFKAAHPRRSTRGRREPERYSGF
jgi:hypothetical protein